MKETLIYREIYEEVKVLLKGKEIYKILIDFRKTMSVYTFRSLSRGVVFPIELVDAHGSEGEDCELYFNDKKKKIQVSKFIALCIKNLQSMDQLEQNQFKRKKIPLLQLHNHNLLMGKVINAKKEQFNHNNYHEWLEVKNLMKNTDSSLILGATGKSKTSYYLFTRRCRNHAVRLYKNQLRVPRRQKKYYKQMMKNKAYVKELQYIAQITKSDLKQVLEKDKEPIE